MDSDLSLLLCMVVIPLMFVIGGVVLLSWILKMAIEDHEREQKSAAEFARRYAETMQYGSDSEKQLILLERQNQLLEEQNRQIQGARQAAAMWWSIHH